MQESTLHLFCAVKEGTRVHLKLICSPTVSTAHEFLDSLLRSKHIEFY